MQQPTEEISIDQKGFLCIHAFPGALLDSRYRLQERLGTGGMGVVFRARDEKLGRTVAIKFVRSDLCTHDILVRRLEREALIGARVVHEHAAQLLDLQTKGASPFLVLEFARGATLASHLSTHGPFSMADTLKIICQVAGAVEEAHESGVIHRDLKPQNIMFRRERDGSPVVKILDFGVARFDSQEDESGISCTATESVGGTPQYMAPEIARGDSPGDERADVYALGVILYELLSASRPYEGNSRNAILYNVAKGAFVPLSERTDQLPAELIEIVHSCMQSDPSLRTPSVAHLADRLREFSANRLLPASTQSAESALNAPRSWAPLLTIAIFALCLGGAAGFSVGSREDDDSAPKHYTSLDSQNEIRTSSSAASPQEISRKRGSPDDENLVAEASLNAPPVRTESPLSTEVDPVTPFAGASSGGAVASPKKNDHPHRKVSRAPSSLWDFETENPYQ